LRRYSFAPQGSLEPPPITLAQVWFSNSLDSFGLERLLGRFPTLLEKLVQHQRLKSFQPFDLLNEDACVESDQAMTPEKSAEAV
jgi:hypothetical protein